VWTRKRILSLAAFFALALALGTAKKAKSLGSPDFKVFYTAARHALHDPENIYRMSPDRYLYPPSTALLLTPFAFSENYEFHRWIWHGFLALLVFALASTGGAALAALALLARYLAITFSYGQINVVVIALLTLVGALGARGRFRPAGSVWALVTSLKIYPAVLAPFFLPRERWRAFGGAALGGTLLFFLPFAFFGIDAGSQLYGDFFGALRSKGLPTHSHNQSLSALLLRLFTRQEFYLHAVGPAHWGVAEVPEGILHAVALAVGGALTYLSWLRAWRRGLAADAALSAACFSVLFLSHIVWKDYLLFLYFPLREGFASWTRAKSYAVAGAFFALITFSSPDFLQAVFGRLGDAFAHYWLTETPTIGHALSVRLDAACIHLWAAALVWVAWL
jgi:hypothetical protein